METHLLLNPAAGTNWRHFLWHLVEMIVVMMLGMCLLGGAFRELHVLVFGNGFAAAWRDHAGLAAYGMAFSMTVPMVLWMRYRGHSWERGGFGLRLDRATVEEWTGSRFQSCAARNAAPCSSSPRLTSPASANPVPRAALQGAVLMP